MLNRIILVLGAASMWSSAAGAQQSDSGASPAALRLYVQSCAVCHGDDAAGTERGPGLVQSRRLRTRSEGDIAAIIRNGTPGGMPAFSIPDDAVQQLAAYVRSLNVTALEAAPAGDVAAGEAFFFGESGCGTCHTAQGRGSSTGPDLSTLGRRLTMPELIEALTDPSARITPGYARVRVRLREGGEVEGYARSRGSHDLQLQSYDGEFHLLSDREFSEVTALPGSTMPPLAASGAQRADLIAWLSRLDGVAEGPISSRPPDPAEFQAIVDPAPGDWSTYYGDLSGNRYTTLDQIDRDNVGRLQLQWIHPMPYQPLETTPLVVGGVMYVTGPNQVAALDGRSGREIWRYSRPRTPADSGIAADAALGANRGVAISGDRVFYATDNAHLIALDRLTGALLWDVPMPEEPMPYGATAAPMVVNDLVISGVAGGDEGIRGFIAAYEVATGELAWRHWTVPKPGERGSETWEGSAIHLGGGATWLTGTYDPELDLLYWPTGNPFPDTDGDERIGDNLYTNSDLALDPRTGELRWHFQFTPHDLHDWDANQPPVLVDAEFRGQDRKLLLHANRNGYFYVLDRVTGEFLLGEPFVEKLTWSSGIDETGRPILTANNQTTEAGVRTCPAVRGATNWYSPAYSPRTGLYYVMSVEDCTLYRKAPLGGFGRIDDPLDPAMKYLRAIDIETGEIQWEVPQVGEVERNYSGVLATSTDLVFYGETSGGFAAVDANTGDTLWHFEAGAVWKGSPMTYSVNGRQYVAIASGANILSFALPEE